ncbi:MAG: hypothetical protein VW982_08045 [Candidatus Poseidoniales archaeon]
MAAQYQVNLSIQAGTDFGQVFYLANPDKSSMDITGCSFSAVLQKHHGAYDATLTTSEEVVYKYIKFNTHVVDGVGGAYQITLDSSQTKLLEEGKYMFNVVMTDINGQKNEVVSGLAFVQISLAAVL